MMPYNPTETKRLIEAYRKHGFCVIPQKYGDITPLVSWKEYANGKKPTEEETTKWFSKPANVAILAGRPSNNLIVIDIEDKELYYKIFPKHKDLEAQTPVVETNRGFHVYCRCDDTTTTRLHEKVEILGDNHLFTAPPSLHEKGTIYRFVDENALGRTPSILEIPNVRDDLRKKLTELGLTSEGDVPVFSKKLPPCFQYALKKGASEGLRDEIAMRIATFLRSKRVSKEDMIKIMIEWNDLNTPPLPTKQIFQKIESAHKNKYTPYSCEKLRQLPIFKEGCSMPCPALKKENEIERSSSALDFLIENTEKQVIHPGKEETFFDFYVSNPKNGKQNNSVGCIHLSPAQLSNSKIFAEKFLSIFYSNYETYNSIFRMKNEDWLQYMNFCEEEKQVVMETEQGSSDDLIVEMLVRKITKMDITLKKENVLEGGGSMFYDRGNNELWIPLKLVQDMLDRDRIKKDIKTVSYLFSEYKINSKNRRISDKQVIKGWNLHIEKFDVIIPDEEPEDEFIEKGEGIDVKVGFDEKVRIVERIIREYCKTNEDHTITEEDIELQAQTKGIPREDIDQIINRLKHNEIICEPTKRVIRLIDV